MTKSEFLGYLPYCFASGVEYRNGRAWSYLTADQFWAILAEQNVRYACFCNQQHFVFIFCWAVHLNKFSILLSLHPWAIDTRQSAKDWNMLATNKLRVMLVEQNVCYAYCVTPHFVKFCWFCFAVQCMIIAHTIDFGSKDNVSNGCLP